MTAELLRQVKALDPIPGDAAMPIGLHSAAVVLQEIDERTATMQTRERTLARPPSTPRLTRRAWIASAAFVTVLVVGVTIALVAGSPPGDSGPAATTETPTTTDPSTTSSTEVPTTTVPATIPETPEGRLGAFLAAVADDDTATANELLGQGADAEFLVATGWVAAAAPCGLENPDDPQFYACEVTTGSAVGDRIGDTTLTMIFEYRETDESFLGWQFVATQFSFEYLYYGLVYDGEAFAAACPDPDFLAGLGRTPECGAYLASINTEAAIVQPAVEPLDVGVTRINGVTAADGVVLQDGENRFDRAQRMFSLFADASASVGVDASSVGSTVLSAVDGTMIEVVSPLLYAAPGAPLGENSVTAPVPLPGLGGFEQWLTAAGFATIADQGEVQLGSVTARFYDIEWTQSGAVMRLAGRIQGDKVVEAGTSERIYVIDHPDGLPLVVFVAPGPGGQDQANATVESVLDGIALRTSPVYP